MKNHQAPFIENFEGLRLMVEESLQRACDFNVSVAPKIKQAMEYSLFAGGKRIRPVLAVKASEIFGANTLAVCECAVVLEILHTYSLVHDDLPCMDDSDLRRGKPSCHKIYGEAVATLAGDGMLTFAWEVLIRVGKKWQFSDELILKSILDLSQAIGANGMIAGQILDLEMENQLVDEQTLRQIHYYKTGCLFGASMALGARLAGAKETDIESLREFGYRFGQIFQITDDSLDVTGTTQELGKPSGIDHKNHKSTYPSVMGLNQSRILAQAECDQALELLKPYSGPAASDLSDLVQWLLIRST